MIYGRLKIGWEGNMDVGDVLNEMFFIIKKGSGLVQAETLG